MTPLSRPALETIARIGQIKDAPCNDAEGKRMLAMARPAGAGPLD